MVRDRYLIRHVVFLKPYVCSGAGHEDVPGLTWCESLQLRHIVLDDEGSTWLQVSRSVAEGLDLFVLSREVRDGVAQKIDQGELSRHHRAGEIAQSHADLGSGALHLELAEPWPEITRFRAPESRAGSAEVRSGLCRCRTRGPARSRPTAQETPRLTRSESARKARATACLTARLPTDQIAAPACISMIARSATAPEST
jgi:hypothetical protein